MSEYLSFGSTGWQLLNLRPIKKKEFMSDIKSKLHVSFELAALKFFCYRPAFYWRLVFHIGAYRHTFKCWNSIHHSTEGKNIWLFNQKGANQELLAPSCPFTARLKVLSRRMTIKRRFWCLTQNWAAHRPIRDPSFLQIVILHSFIISEHMCTVHGSSFRLIKANSKNVNPPIISRIISCHIVEGMPCITVTPLT